jgi:hypothetical protein
MTRRRGIVIGVGLAALALVGLWGGWVVYRRCDWRVERLMSRFASTPDQETADKLCELLDNQRVSKEVGSRILKMLTKPKVEVRDPYPAGEELVWGRHTLTWAGRFRKLALLGGVRVEGAPADRYAWESPLDGYFSSFPYPFEPPSTQTDGTACRSFDLGAALPAGDDGQDSITLPGDTAITERWSVQLHDYHDLDRHEGLRLPSLGDLASWVRSGFRTRVRMRHPPRTVLGVYACEHEVTYAVHIASVEQCNRIRLRRDDRLDEGMKGAIAFRDSIERDGVTVKWRPYIQYAQMLENVAFRTAFREEGATTARDLRNVYVARKGQSGTWELRTDALSPGKHKGTLVLTPDPVLALRLAGVKEIWGGTVELPVEFEIANEPISTESEAAKGEAP